jgi:hypothetical protein
VISVIYHKLQKPVNGVLNQCFRQLVGARSYDGAAVGVAGFQRRFAKGGEQVV